VSMRRRLETTSYTGKAWLMLAGDAGTADGSGALRFRKEALQVEVK